MAFHIEGEILLSLDRYTNALLLPVKAFIVSYYISNACRNIKTALGNDKPEDALRKAAGSLDSSFSHGPCIHSSNVFEIR